MDGLVGQLEIGVGVFLEEGETELDELAVSDCDDGEGIIIFFCRGTKGTDEFAFGDEGFDALCTVFGEVVGTKDSLLDEGESAGSFALAEEVLTFGKGEGLAVEFEEFGKAHGGDWDWELGYGSWMAVGDRVVLFYHGWARIGLGVWLRSDGGAWGVV